MYCSVLSPSFLQFLLCDIRIVDLTRRCKPLVFAFYYMLTMLLWSDVNTWHPWKNFENCWKKGCKVTLWTKKITSCAVINTYWRSYVEEKYQRKDRTYKWRWAFSDSGRGRYWSDLSESCSVCIAYASYRFWQNFQAYWLTTRSRPNWKRNYKKENSL